MKRKKRIYRRYRTRKKGGQHYYVGRKKPKNYGSLIFVEPKKHPQISEEGSHMDSERWTDIMAEPYKQSKERGDEFFTYDRWQEPVRLRTGSHAKDVLRDSASMDVERPGIVVSNVADRREFNRATESEEFIDNLMKGINLAKEKGEAKKGDPIHSWTGEQLGFVE